MSLYDRVFENNQRWIEKNTASDADFFAHLAQGQEPGILYIGCSDSRVTAEELMGMKPGEVFVHRNLANLIKQADMNCLSVMQFAIDVLKVRHVIVCGHYGCSGVKAAMVDDRVGLSDNWLAQIRSVCAKHVLDLERVEETDERHRLLCELNVIEQVTNACETTVVRDAWNRGQALTVHGLIYGIEDGLLHDLGVSTSTSTRHW